MRNLRRFVMVCVFLSTSFFNTALAQLPPSVCSPQGGTRADIVAVQTAYRGLNGTHPTFTIPAGATGAQLSISSHSSVIASPNSDQILGDEDFITISAHLDLTSNTSSGILNFARSTLQTGAETNLYSWLKVSFGTNVSSQIDKGQSTPALLNDLTITRIGNQLTITQSSAVIQSSYLIEFTNSANNSLIENGTQRIAFTGGVTNLRTAPVPANTNLIVISRKGTVRVSNYDANGGTEEGYSDERLILDLDNNKLSGFSTVANGAALAHRSTYTIQDHTTNSTTRFLSTGKVAGDFTSKSTTSRNTAPLSDVGISNSAVYFTGTPAAGGTLTIDELPAYTGAFDGVYVIEYYSRTGLGMSVAFIDTRTAFIQKGAGTSSGTSRVIPIPAGADFIFIKQAGNANNSTNAHNENSLESFAVINLNANPPSATGYFYQQVGFTNATTRRDDNYGFLNLPLDGTSSRNSTYSEGYYTSNQQPGGGEYDLTFTLAPNRSTLTVTNKYGLVASEYQTITEARFYGRRPDLGFSTLSSDFISANNGSCGGVAVTVTVCNPGSGNSPGNFPVSFYDKDPTTDGTAKLLHIGTYENAVAQGNCNSYSFVVDLKDAGYNNPNIPIYCVINDNGSYVTGGVGNAVGTPFTLNSLATQDPNSNYIECDYSNNLRVVTIVNVMACPTANQLTTTNQSPTLNGTWDNINTQTNGLTVTVNGVPYVLGTNPELTVSGNTWTLNLSNITLPIATYPVTAVTTNANGTATDGTTNELVIKDIGTVFLDLNGLEDATINGTGIQTIAASQLYINIINSTTNNVAAVVPVGAGGAYVMPALPARNYIFQLSTTAGTVGNARQTATLPTGYVFTGEGTTANGDGTANGEVLINVVNESTLVPDFGIQQRPSSGAPNVTGVVANNVIQGNRFNPGVFGGFEVPAQGFGGTDDGVVTHIRITALTNNILSFTNNGITYYRSAADFPVGCPSATCMALPVGGVLIPTNAQGQPSQPITLATNASFLDGTLGITYRTVDNANFESSATTTLNIPMIALKYENGAWHNGAGASNQPNNTDNTKTLFWVSNGGTLTSTAEVKNLMIYDGITGTIGASTCLVVNDATIAQGTGKLHLLATSDHAYGQYLGPGVMSTVEMTMEAGFHNIGMPVNLSVGEWADQLELAIGEDVLNIDPATPERNTLRWYNTRVSGGEEFGFFINRGNQNAAANNPLYTSHSYGTWELPDATTALTSRGFSLAISENTAPLANVTMDAGVKRAITIPVTGTTNDQSMTYETSNNFGGWNLLPNAYPVTLSTLAMFNDGFFDDANGDPLFDRALMLWDANDDWTSPLQGRFSKGAYRLYDVELNYPVTPRRGARDNNNQLVNQGANIAPFQSFYVRRLDASTERRENVDGGAVHANEPAVAAGVAVDPAVTEVLKNATIKPIYRTSCVNKVHYKTQVVADVMLLEVENIHSKMIDGMSIAFADHYTNGIDRGYDIQKMAQSGSNLPAIFSVMEGQSLAINKMQWPTEATTVPVGFDAADHGAPFEVRLAENTGNYTVYLEDLKTGKWQDLTQGGYTFLNDVDFALERFKLHFKMGTASINDFHPGIRAWGVAEGIQVQFHHLVASTAHVRITDAVGRVLFEGGNISTRADFVYPMQVASGLYTITVTTENQVLTEKIIK
jgi:hypothetical protein